MYSDNNYTLLLIIIHKRFIAYKYIIVKWKTICFLIVHIYILYCTIYIVYIIIEITTNNNNNKPPHTLCILYTLDEIKLVRVINYYRSRHTSYIYIF